MIGTIFVGFTLSFLILFFGKYIKNKFNFIYTAYPIFCLLAFIPYITQISSTTHIIAKQSWVPQYGINLNLRIDGFSLLFALLISGIGSLIYLYTHKYLYGQKNIDKFFAYLTLFMSSMLGLVLSDNTIALFIFWELTSISSFFLIGFNSDDETSRKNAKMALSVTGFGGFFLLASFIWIGQIVGSYDFSDILAQKELILNNSGLPFILAFLFIGAFTKSAQFPFQFWLPNAMKAPTPVSAFLHSATMVKAGIFLLARFFPIVGTHEIWTSTLTIIGCVTMLYGAFNSLYKTDLKAILAYSTISMLGIFVLLLGIGTPMAIKAFTVLIVAHALYKASLFMITGIIDHEAHTRDITLLSGLKKIMPLVFISGILTIISSAGIPLTFGFIAKELLYESILHSNLMVQISWFLLIAAIIANILSAYASFQVGIKPFVGILPEKYEKNKPVHIFLVLPTLLLAVAGIFYGIVPQIADQILINNATNAIFKSEFVELPLKIWHGFNIILLLSGITILSSIGLFLARKISKKKEDYLNNYSNLKPEILFENFKNSIKQIGYKYTQIMHNGYLRIYIMTIICFIIIVVGYRLFTEVPLEINTAQLSSFRLYELVVFFIILVAVFVTITTQSRLTSIASMSIVGYCICLMFVFYGAPDLAMTQFTIDTLTLVLFVLVLFRLPPFMSYAKPKIIIRDAIISLIFGALISIITLQALVSPAEKELSKFYADNAYLMAKGKNIVNVILVDFRGFDTLVETIVLTIAALGVYSLLKLQVSSSDKE